MPRRLLFANCLRRCSCCPETVSITVYDFLRWDDGERSPAGMAHHDKDGSTVVSLGSFTKLLGPGLRLGWVQVGGQGSSSPLLKQILSLGCVRSGGSINAWVGAVCTDLIESGMLSQHINLLRQVWPE